MKNNIAVIYNSQTGFTRRYAEWIAENTGADCYALSDARKVDFSGYRTIVFGSWISAGRVSHLDWFKRHLDEWRQKKLIVFCVGASPVESPEVETALKQNFGGREWEGVQNFYCPGGLDYAKMPARFRLMLRMFVSMLRKKRDKTAADEQMIQMLSSSYNLSDWKYVLPLLKSLEDN